MKLNLRDRRRLTPLSTAAATRSGRCAILFSLPGSPVLYCGDEIGMGDNVYHLGDRDGVRSIQWTGDPPAASPARTSRSSHCRR
jgi:maltose alpha-D-glucosyltransferase/alpha-amylase